MKIAYINSKGIREGYKSQLIYYYNNKGKKSDIAGAIITDKLISILEERYKQLGGSLPIPIKEIKVEKGKKWQLL